MKGIVPTDRHQAKGVLYTNLMPPCGRQTAWRVWPSLPFSSQGRIYKPQGSQLPTRWTYCYGGRSKGHEAQKRRFLLAEIVAKMANTETLRFSLGHTGSQDLEVLTQCGVTLRSLKWFYMWNYDSSHKLDIKRMWKSTKGSCTLNKFTCKHH